MARRHAGELAKHMNLREAKWTSIDGYLQYDTVVKGGLCPLSISNLHMEAGCVQSRTKIALSLCPANSPRLSCEIYVDMLSLP